MVKTRKKHQRLFLILCVFVLLPARCSSASRYAFVVLLSWGSQDGVRLLLTTSNFRQMSEIKILLYLAINSPPQLTLKKGSDGVYVDSEGKEFSLSTGAVRYLKNRTTIYINCKIDFSVSNMNILIQDQLEWLTLLCALH